MTKAKLEAILPEGWSRPRGYSYAIRAEGQRTVYVAGQLGVENGKLPVAAYDDFGRQWDLALGNVVRLVRDAGGGAEHIATMRIYVTSIEDFNAAAAAVGAAWGKHLGKHFPAMTMIEISRLVDPRAKVEIEAEAVLP